MARAGYANVVADSFGNRLAGAGVEVRQPGTATPVTGPLYVGPTGAATLGNPLTVNSLGAFAFYRDGAETVDLHVTAPGYTALTLGGVAVAVDGPVLDGAQLVNGSVTGAQIADGSLTDADVVAANKDGASGTASLRTLGTGAAQAAAGNHGHTHGSLSGVGANDHHAQSHALTGTDHTVSGLTAGHVARATGATSWAFGALQRSDLPAVPHCRATRGSNQSITSGAVTAIQFDGETGDNDTMHDNAINNSRITFNTAGWYDLTGWAQWDSGATGGARRAWAIRLNGTTDLARAEQSPPAAGAFPAANLATSFQAAQGDYVELPVYHDHGSAVNVTIAALTATWRCP